MATDVSMKSLSSKYHINTPISYLIHSYRVANGAKKDADGNKPGKYSRKYRDTKDDMTQRDENGGLKFVYPYGSTINVRKPSVALLSSGPISFPANRPVGAFYVSPRRGKLFIMGSM